MRVNRSSRKLRASVPLASGQSKQVEKSPFTRSRSKKYDAASTCGVMLSFVGFLRVRGTWAVGTKKDFEGEFRYCYMTLDYVTKP